MREYGDRGMRSHCYEADRICPTIALKVGFVGWPFVRESFEGGFAPGLPVSHPVGPC